MKQVLALALASLVVLAGCGKPSADEYFSKAQGEYKAAKAAADTVQNREEAAKLFEPAVEDFQKVVQEYPGSPLAEDALFRIAAIRNNEMHDLDRAIVSYKQFVDRYPDAKKAPEATFIVGYLYNNDLHQLDSATVWLNRFLERFPQHELAVSAQFELSQLGKSPDDLLPADSTAVQKQGLTVGSKSKKLGGRQHPM